MANPRVFVSSTYYDLKYIRQNIKYFVKTLGYEPVLSEEGDVFFNPKQHTHDSCLTEVSTCQIFVLIIGGRFGGKQIKGEKSITNIEYLEAVRQKLPIFALVESSVYHDHHVYIENKNNEIEFTKIKYPSIDNIKIFEFIDEVRKNVVNNAVVPFNDFSDIESYLKKQWAGMLYNFLTIENEADRITNTLDEIAKINLNIQNLSTQILNSVGSQEAILTAKLYETMLYRNSVKNISYSQKAKPKPFHIIKYKTFNECAKALGVNFVKVVNADFSISTSGEIAVREFEKSSKDYLKLRDEFEAIVKDMGWSFEKYIEEYNNSQKLLEKK